MAARSDGSRNPNRRRVRVLRAALTVEVWANAPSPSMGMRRLPQPGMTPSHRSQKHFRMCRCIQPSRRKIGRRSVPSGSFHPDRFRPGWAHWSRPPVATPAFLPAPSAHHSTPGYRARLSSRMRPSLMTDLSPILRRDAYAEYLRVTSRIFFIRPGTVLNGSVGSSYSRAR
jgi:hypothetical protein